MNPLVDSLATFELALPNAFSDEAGNIRPVKTRVSSGTEDSVTQKTDCEAVSPEETP